MVLIADDHPLFRKGMRSLLEAFSDFEVVDEAATGKRPSGKPRTASRILS
jgi:DNA-binding NarL/FixJ family response regulator